MFIFIILTLSMNQGRAIDLRPGKPVPNADILESIIKSQLGNASDSSGLVFHYLEGDDDISEGDGDDFNVNILDVASVKNLVTVFKKRYERELASQQKDSDTYRRSDPQAINQTLESKIIPQAFLMMQQSIYAIRYRLQDTNKYRKTFKKDVSYNIAILAGSMDMIVLKMDNLRREMRELAEQTHFIWYLLIYEKLLTMLVDVGYITNRIWILQTEFLKSLLGTEEADEGPDLGPGAMSGEDDKNATAAKPPQPPGP